MTFLDILQSPVIAGIISGIITGLMAIIGMRVDIKWIKKELDEHDARIYNLESPYNKNRRKVI